METIVIKNITSNVLNQHHGELLGTLLATTKNVNFLYASLLRTMSTSTIKLSYKVNMLEK